MALKYVLFDLDGTLTDSMLGITNCAMYALEKFGIHPKSREELLPYIGPPLVESFQQFHGLSPEQAVQAVAYYRERFSTIGWKENAVYSGVEALLQELQASGLRLIVATSKPEVYTNLILEHFDLKKYFTFVAGSTLDGLRDAKAEVIAHIRKSYADIGVENTVMVGDRRHDVIGAHHHRLRVIGVLYGYGDRAEMEAVGADFIVSDIQELRLQLLVMANS